MRGITDKDLGMQAWLSAIRKAGGNSYTKVGLPAESSPASVANGHSSNQIDLVKLAAIHEFGAPNKNIPERSFIRSSYDENLHKLKQIKEVEAINIVEGRSTVRQSLSRMGEWMTAKIKNKIRSNIPPALKHRKGTALIDSGQLIQSITHVEVIQ